MNYDYGGRKQDAGQYLQYSPGGASRANDSSSNMTNPLYGLNSSLLGMNTSQTQQAGVMIV